MHPVARRFTVDAKTGHVRAILKNTGAQNRPPVPASPTSSAVDSPDLHSEILALRSLVEEVIHKPNPATPTPSTQSTQSNVEFHDRSESASINQSLSSRRALDLPESLFRQYLTLIEREVAAELAESICRRIRAELTPPQLADDATVHAALVRHLSRFLPTLPASANPNEFQRPLDGRPLTIALVGPTGVGKTTTIAKLAATHRLRQQRTVGLITTDTYRIAAVEQLRTYAEIIDVPMRVATSPEEMIAACREFADRDVILIDTAGRSPGDWARLEDIRRLVESAAPHEVHLVLSSTASEASMLLAVERFADLRPDRVILTKLDEAVTLGVVVNVMRRAGKRISYLTTGQEVPDEIEVGRSDRLARLVLGADALTH